MQIQYKNTVLFVKDIASSRAFYLNILNQKIQFDFNKSIGFESGLSLWEIQEGHPIREKLTIDNFDSTRIELYFETEDIDRMFDLLKVQQVEFFHEIHEEIWGQRTIRFFDPDHHLIEIGEPIPTFVKRLSKTLSPEEVSQKTSVSIEEVNKILSEHD